MPRPARSDESAPSQRIAGNHSQTPCITMSRRKTSDLATLTNLATATTPTVTTNISRIDLPLRGKSLKESRNLPDGAGKAA